MQYRMVRQIAAGAAVAAVGFALASPAAAQDGAALMDLNDRDLRQALEMRYEAALAGTLNPAIVIATDARYHWATEAKAQCAIAIGFMKHSLRDADSIRKCDAAYGRFITPPPAPPMPPPPPAPERPAMCDQAVSTVFFDFDSRSAPPTAVATAQFLHSNTQACGWTGFDVVGHTDRSGSDVYNDALAIERAQSVADVLVAHGVDASTITVAGRGEHEPAVPTVDGERNPQNRRVVITVR